MATRPEAGHAWKIIPNIWAAEDVIAWAKTLLGKDRYVLYPSNLAL
jgi:hypothetical protein